jgi:diacylglycerol kinase family enzyme
MTARPSQQLTARTSTVPGQPSGAPPLGSRIAAAAASTVSLATLVVLVVFTAQELVYVAVSILCGALCISMPWIAATNRRFRWAAAVAAAALLGGAMGSLLAAGRGLVAVVAVFVGIAIASALGTLALRWEVRQVLAVRWHKVPAARNGVLLLNPRSGDGKAARVGLVDEARRRGIHLVMFEHGDNLRELAETAVSQGADVLGMAGGDGSQGVVAGVAADAGVPFICIPVGTRNHLALDLGIDRDDPVGALDAFGPARETSIDLGEVNGETFVNNVSLGIYARIVGSDEYRAAKRRTVAELLPELLGPGAMPSGLTVEGPEGRIADAAVIQVSNNPYRLSSLTGFGSRARLNGGALGVATLSVTRTTDVNRLVALEGAGHPERYKGWRQWTDQHVVVDGPPPLAAAVDGEARTWASPLRCRVRPGVLRVRIPPGQAGASPAFLRPPLSVTTFVGLARISWGRPSGIIGD